MASDHLISVMTYNVHRCIGTDRAVSPRRIARVIAELAPDVVALQELPGGRFRPDGDDLAEELRKALAELCDSRPYPFMERERCGNVIFSRYPMRLVRAGGLHSEKRRRSLVPRGALWVELTVGDAAIQLINTHLGLTRPEQTSQVRVLMGKEWLEHPACRAPIILCGDFNVLPASSVHRRLRGSVESVGGRLNDAQQAVLKGRKDLTFPSRRPLLRLDHLFVSPELAVQNLVVPQTGLARVASDHLPLLAQLRLENSSTSSAS